MAEVPEWEPSRLEAAIKRGDPRALEAFYSHFRPLLLEHARHLGVEGSMRDEVVMTFIGDMLLQLQRSRVFPDRLDAYMLTSFRYYAGALMERDPAVRASFETGSETAPDDRQVVIEACSDFSRRAASRADNELTDSHAAASAQGIRAFWRSVSARLSHKERVLLQFVYHEAPDREIGAALKMTNGAVRVARHRLRERVRELGEEEVTRLPRGQREQVTAILRRGGYLSKNPESDGGNRRERSVENRETRLS